MDDVINTQHIPVLVAPDKGSRATPKRWLTDGRANWMRTVLKSDDGHRRYAKRKQTVEPLYGDTKHNRGFIRFHRRGRSQGAYRVQVTDDDPQPHQGLQAPNSHHRGLNGPHPVTTAFTVARHQRPTHHPAATAKPEHL